MNQKDFNDKLAAEAKKRRKELLGCVNRGWSVTNIAEYLGISKQRVSQLLKRARDEQ